MRINRDQIHMDGESAPDNEFLSFGTSKLANYVFRASQVYDLRMGVRKRVDDVYEIVSLHTKTAKVRPVTNNETLGKFASLILMGASQNLSFPGRKVNSSESHLNDEMSPFQKAAFQKYVERDSA